MNDLAPHPALSLRPPLLLALLIVRGQLLKHSSTLCAVVNVWSGGGVMAGLSVRALALVASLTLSLLVVSLSYYSVFIVDNPNYCTMTYMNARLLPVPLANVSRLERKYSLFVYREGPIYDLQGEPVLPLSLADACIV